MIQNLVIVGGGTAGWMVAAALCHLFQDGALKITLIESEAIGTVGVGEASIPHLRYFNERLGINEHEFMRVTNATFKLGIEFANWRKVGHSYIHPFGEIGFPTKYGPFYHYWSRAQQLGLNLSADEFSIATHMARLGRFTYPSKNDSELLSTFSYAFHLDAARYALFLRQFCERHFKGFSRIEGKIEHVLRNPDTGDISTLVMEGGGKIAGDFFIDCSGFRSLLLSQTLGAKPLDMSEYLPANSAIAVPTDETYPDMPYSRATAHSAGWQWRIPLQHRTGNGHVYCSEFISDDEAAHVLMSNLDGEAMAEPRMVKFTTGHRQRFWEGNCVAVGLSSGFMEPLESTSIWMVQNGIARLLANFPDLTFADATRDRYNRLMLEESEYIRDFLVLHYYLNRGRDSPFWEYCRNMELPERLAEKIRVFEATGRCFRENDELFNDTSWFAVMVGQGLEFGRYDPVAELLSLEETRHRLAEIKRVIANSVDYMPAHRQFIADNCAAA